jgi:sugar phosphate isomerase/epimerase
VTIVKIAVQTRSLRQPLRAAVASVARLGADGVEIDARRELLPAELSQTGLRQIRKLLGDFNLKVSAIAFPTRRGYDVPDDLERRVLATQAAMRMAYELEAGVVINRVGHVPADSGDEAWRRLVDVLTVLGAYGERVGARLAAQTGDGDPAHLARLIAALPEATVGVDLHPAGLIQSGFSPEQAVAELGRYVMHVHACDAVRDSSAGMASEVTLGRGQADMPALLARLTAQFDYRGWVTIERRDVVDPHAEIENGIAYLRAL